MYLNSGCSYCWFTLTFFLSLFFNIVVSNLLMFDKKSVFVLHLVLNLANVFEMV